MNPRNPKTQQQPQRQRVAVVETSPDKAGILTLTPEEEKVIRMRYGLSESDDAWLSFGVGASADTMLNLAMVEANNIVQLDGEVPVSGGEFAAPAREAIASLIARYGVEA